MNEKRLGELRDRIRDIDEEILKLTSERMTICREVGLYKKDHNLPVKNYRVEKEILERTKELAHKFGIMPELAQRLMKDLIHYSVVEQEEIKSTKMSSVYSESHRNVLVIGGGGNMGLWMSQFFETFGHQIKILDRNQQLSSRFEQVSDLASGCDWADFIVIATPMKTAADIIQDLVRLKPKATIIEICSLKSPIEQSIQTAKRQGLSLISIHPMFGPDTKLLAGKNIVICNDENPELVSMMRQIFSMTSANIIEIPLSQHDPLMSYVLGSAHFINLVYARLLKRSAISYSDLQKIAGTTFEKQMSVTSDVLLENQDLYFDIQSLNAETDALIDDFVKASQEMQSQIIENRRQEFKTQMAESLKYLIDSE
ncbi:MAG: bifunctional chorismate mutase/prephenate dehydrogenase [Pseudobacteriovorax sp.]|nr:bifunctional chorismate mutase/prephenate dehydrogenase [Pseudobacteriovorax sp.]